MLLVCNLFLHMNLCLPPRWRRRPVKSVFGWGAISYDPPSMRMAQPFDTAVAMVRRASAKTLENVGLDKMAVAMIGIVVVAVDGELLVTLLRTALTGSDGAEGIWNSSLGLALCTWLQSDQ